MRKKAFEFSFAWLFGLIVGAAILFLAIYASIKVIGTESYRLNTVTAKQLSIIFEPLETGLATGKSFSAELKEETRIYDECKQGGFGSQEFSLSSKGFGGKWSERGADISVTNKYIFSDDVEEGKTIYFFSKPFEMPWKISEIIFLTTEQYCFIDAPDFIKDEISGLTLANIKLDNCSNKDIRVCFSSNSDCDIKVSGTCSQDCNYEYGKYDYGFVSKENGKIFYTDSLIYAAIFSSEDVYECNVERLISRMTEQALLYNDEANFLTTKCSALASTGLIQLSSLGNIKSSEDLLLIRKIAKQTEEQNDVAECKLW